MHKNWLHIIFISVILFGCGGKEWKENPVDQILKKNKDAHTLTVLLNDMNVKNKDYFHKYKIITVAKEGAKPESKVTDWKQVSEPTFIRHENNLGMEILTKDENGKVNKIPSPPGYTNYVGNKKYGEWRGQGDDRRWHFFSQYLFMSSMLHFVYGPVYYRGYSRYNSHYRNRRPYYGMHSRSSRYNQYGTKSSKLKKSRPSFYRRRSQKSNFRSRYRGYTTGSTRGGGGFGK